MTRTLARATVWFGILGSILLLVGCQQEGAKGPMTAQAYVAAAKKTVVELPPQQAAKLIEDPNVFLLDVQLPGEYDLAHLHGAVLIPRGYVELKIAKNDLFPAINRGRVPKLDQPILVYCSLGSRSLLAARTLQDMGYANVRTIQGGLKTWTDAGLPVEKTTPTSRPAGK
jgi:rhodanese-related sulfurtransferase